MNIEKLPQNFEGRGDTKGYTFEKKHETEKGYVFKVIGDHTPHYEAFLKKTTAARLDFQNRAYSETDFKEVYPKTKDFGVWAWTSRDFNNILKYVL